MNPTETRTTSPACIGQSTLAYAPIISSESRYLGLRLLLGPSTPGAAALAPCLNALGPFIASLRGIVLLEHQGFAVDAGLAEWDVPSNAVLVTSAILIKDPAIQDLLKHLHQTKAVRMAVQGRADVPLAREMIPMFEYALIRDTEDRRRKQDLNAPTPYRRIPFITIDDPTQERVEAAFFAGAIAAIGWPKHFPHPPQATPPAQPPQMAAIRFFAMVNNGAGYEQMCSALSLAPAILARLLKVILLLDQPAVPVDSFEAAFARYGHAGLVRFMTALLLMSSRDFKALALVHAALVRGLFLQQLAPPEEGDRAFVVGALSLADHITMTRFDTLLALIGLPAPLAQAIAQPDAAWRTRLDLVDAIERGDMAAIAPHLASLAIDQAAANAALCTALGTADRLLRMVQPA